MQLSTAPKLAAIAFTWIVVLPATAAHADAANGSGYTAPRTGGNTISRPDAGSTDSTQPISRTARPITPAKSSKKNQRGSSSILRTIGALLFIVTLIFVGAKLLKKHTPRLSGGIPREALEVLGKRTIDQKQVVHLLRLGSRILVVGGSQQGLQTLAEITDPVEVDYLAGMCQRDETESRFTQGFLALFRREPGGEPADDAGNQAQTSTAAVSRETQTERFSAASGSDELAERLNALKPVAAEQRHA